MTQNRKLRAQLVNADSVESRITALQISALRRLGISSQIYLLDENNNTSKRVARQLNRMGFQNCFVVVNGFPGWVQAKLKIKSSPVVYKAEVMAPGRLLGPVLGGNTQRRKVSTDGKKLLPPGK